VEATLLDLSLTGAACVVEVVPVEMRKSELMLVLKADEQEVSVAVRVVRVEREPFGGCLIRLKFDEVTFEQAKPLARLVTDLRMEFNRRQSELATDRLGKPHPSRFPQYPPRDRQR
jgi:c-di-GMP-binding flagellar brake protein YcgR